MTIAADRIFRFKLVKRDFGPLASSIILHIARAHRIGGNLAQVVEERNGKQRITGILIGCPQVRNLQKPLCNGDGMRTQAAFLSPMKPGTCRCSIWSIPGRVMPFAISMNCSFVVIIKVPFLIMQKEAGLPRWEVRPFKRIVNRTSTSVPSRCYLSYIFHCMDIARSVKRFCAPQHCWTAFSALANTGHSRRVWPSYQPRSAR